MQHLDGAVVYSATDLVGFVECEHLPQLERAALAGLVARPQQRDARLDRIERRGIQHEERFLAGLRDEGLGVESIEWDDETPARVDRYRGMAAATLEAMRRGADVVYQATFFDGRRFGRADFLRRVARPSGLGDWSYEVWDTKLAHHARASAVLQLCFYSDLLGAAQGIAPERMHLALGGSAGETVSFRVDDYAACYRMVTREFEAMLAAGPACYPPSTRPDPVEHCDVCRWNLHCRATRRAARDLSLTANLSARQRRALRERGVETIDSLASLRLPLDPPLERGSESSLEQRREQARIQVEGERAERILSERLEPARRRDGTREPAQGLLMLPAPSAGDLFFDIEGDPFVAEHGLDGVDYLFGVIEPVRAGGDGAGAYHSWWAIDASGRVTADAERRAFEAFIDLVTERLQRDPALHVYHYAPYEPTAVKRLAGRYGTREEEVDRLLRAGVFVDLYRAVRQGVRASVESYSLKRVEALYAERWQRAADLRSADESIVEFETWLETGEGDGGERRDALLRDIAAYNRDDCLSTLHLRDWLEGQRAALARELGEELPRPVAGEPDAGEQLSAELEETRRLVERLTTDVPADLAQATAEQHARWLLAQLLGWHRREDKSKWWRYFFLKNELTDEERTRERDALGQLTPTGETRDARRSRVYRFRFPPQEHRIQVGDHPHDPATGEAVGTVEAIDDEAGWIEIARERTKDPPAPSSLIPAVEFPAREQRASLRRIAAWVTEHGIDAHGPYRAGRDLLLRLPPRGAATQPGPAAPAAAARPIHLALDGIGATPAAGPHAAGEVAGHAPRGAAVAGGSTLQRTGETPREAALCIVPALDGGALAIQGPPGSGKTTLGGELIVELVRRGQRVGVVATSHKVIGQLLDEVARAAAQRGERVRIGQKPQGNEAPTCATAQRLSSNDDVIAALAAREVDVVGGTNYLWCRDDVAGAVDTLFVDEAGQISLANVLACAGAARNLVLLGDPQQLEQPLQGVHPPGADRSALAHLLDGAETMPAALGLFLDGTYRLHPDFARFTSELFYEGRLHAHPGCERQRVIGEGPLAGSGLRFVAVEHAGNASESEEEARAVAELVRELLASGARWIDARGEERPLRLEDVLVIAPYNAQVRQIAELLPGARVGTVDKFQGQQAPVAIYSMATSSPDEAPHGMEFLYSLNRLNVATSRARCVAAVVASPELARARCRTPRQMRLANALVRVVEVGG